MVPLRDLFTASPFDRSKELNFQQTTLFFYYFYQFIALFKVRDGTNAKGVCCLPCIFVVGCYNFKENDVTLMIIYY